MQPAGTVAEFIRDSDGRWVGGRTFVVWSAGKHLSGAVIWGRPTESDFEDFFRIVDGYQRDAVDRDVITDVSRIESVDTSAYVALVENMRRRLPWYAERVRRHAMVRGDGLLGGLAEGFFPLIDARHRWRIFSNAAAAFQWTGQRGAADVCREVGLVADHASGLDADQRRVRDFLAAHLTDATLGSTAAAFGASERTLHRVLQAAGTNFRDLLAAARVDAARRLLIETDLKIESIAARVGCSSHAHMTALFRRTTGQTPVEYRTKMRAAHGR
jgi:AraC-like DNA-binding protein